MKNQFLTTVYFLVAVLFLSNTSIAQDSLKSEKKVRPFRIGAKIGFPNALGGNIEYVAPLMGKKLAASIEYSSIDLNKYLDPGDTGKYTYFGAGLNYYFFRPGHGLYTHLGYAKIDASYISEDWDTNTNGSNGTGIVKFSEGLLNVRLGAKWGGLFYFRPEIGYMFGFPDTVDVVVEYADGTSEIQKEELPKEIPKGLMINIGFGLSF